MFCFYLPGADHKILVKTQLVLLGCPLNRTGPIAKNSNSGSHEAYCIVGNRCHSTFWKPGAANHRIFGLQVWHEADSLTTMCKDYFSAFSAWQKSCSCPKLRAQPPLHFIQPPRENKEIATLYDTICHYFALLRLKICYCAWPLKQSADSALMFMWSFFKTRSNQRAIRKPEICCPRSNGDLALWSPRCSSVGKSLGPSETSFAPVQPHFAPVEEAFRSLGPKDLLQPLLTTFESFLFRPPSPRRMGLQNYTHETTILNYSGHYRCSFWGSSSLISTRATD